MGTPMYVSLDYKQYKALEEQFAKGCGPLESFHRTEDRRFYHKAIRFRIGDLEFEITGPMVMAPKGQTMMEAAGLAHSQEGSDH